MNTRCVVNSSCLRTFHSDTPGATLKDAVLWSLDTVTILAQGTLWASAHAQAYFIVACPGPNKNSLLH